MSVDYLDSSFSMILDFALEMYSIPLGFLWGLGWAAVYSSFGCGLPIIWCPGLIPGSICETLCFRG